MQLLSSRAFVLMASLILPLSGCNLVESTETQTPADPVDPVDSVDSVDSVDPVDPVDPVEVDDTVKITVTESQNIAPASWTLNSETELEITAFQWSFSDESYEAFSENQQSEVTHVFEEPGTYTVRLNYQTSTGEQGVEEREIVVKGGSISGLIYAAADHLVDNDTRDLNEPTIDNDTVEKAQLLSSVTSLSGIVDNDDPIDFYNVTLQQYQRLQVQMADKIEATGVYKTIKLSLYSSSDASTLLLEAETDPDSGHFTSTVLVPESDEYIMKISAVGVEANPADSEQSSHGIYSLSIERANSSSSAEFALDEVNVLLKPNRQYTAQALFSKLDLGRFKNLTLENASALMESAKITYASIASLGKSSEALMKAQQRWEVLQAVEVLSKNENIEIAEPNWVRYPAEVTEITDPRYAEQWSYDVINLPQAWEALDGFGDENVIVAVLDTGVLVNHPDLSENIIAGYDFVDNDSDANDPGDRGFLELASSFHGTHVAGTVAAAVNGIGVTGVAPNVKLMPVRVLGTNGGYSSDIIAGVCFAAKLTESTYSGCGNNNSPSQRADIINMSLGGEGYSQLEENVYEAAIGQGVIIIAAAGNEETSASYYPAAYDDVVSVSAVSQSLEQASYSNFGSKIDVAAPGGELSSDGGVLSTWGEDGSLFSPSTKNTYGSLQGTSMAAPHVSGVAALMKSAKPSLTNIEFLSLLNDGALTQDLGASGRDDIFGYGLIDAQKAVLAVQDNVIPQLISSSNQLFFSSIQSSLSIIISATGISSVNEGGEITADINAGGSGGDWLTINTSEEAASSDDLIILEKFQLSVNRDGLEEGIYQKRITVRSTNQVLDDLSILVRLQVANIEVSANAGVQYVLLISEVAEADEGGVRPTLLGGDAVIANNGQYEYELLDVKKGRYYLATGSDIDRDEQVCDSGESCGQYPTLEQPKVVVISEETPDLKLNMSVGYAGGEGISVQTGSFEKPAEKE